MKLYAIHNERVFEFVRQDLYQKRDGSAGAIAYWRCTCVVCGAPFEVSTPAFPAAAEKSKSFAQVHCEQHKSARRRPGRGA